jgi:peptidyl-prolyl cis-trans isomerase D
MITAMRSGLKSGGMAYVIWIAIASMLLGYIVPLFFKQKGGEPWAMRINGTHIPYKTFASELASTREYIALLRAHYGQFAEYVLQNAGITDARSMAFRTLVTQELAHQALDKNKLALHPDYIAHKMHDAEFVQQHVSDLLPQHLIAADGSVDGKMLKEYLQRRGITMQSFEQKIADKVGMWFLSHAVDLFAYVPDYAANYAVTQQQSKKGFTYINVAYQDFVTKEQQKEAITAEEIAAFFEQENRRIKRYEVPEKRYGLQWEFTPETYGISVDDRAIEAYYEQHKAKEFTASPSTMQIRQIVVTIDTSADTSYKTAASQKAWDIHAMLVQQPDSFAEIARTSSDDTHSASKGGLLDPFARGTKDRVLERAAFSLQRDGEISPVLELSDQFVVIQRVHKEPQSYKPLKEVRSTIEKKIRTMEFKTAFNNDARTVLEAKESSAHDLFNKEHRGVKKGLSEITRSEKPVSRALFELKSGDYGVYTEGTNGYIIHLDSVEPAYTPAFEAVEKEVKQDLIAQRARAAFNKEGQRLLTLIRANPIKQVAEDEGFKTHSLTPFSAQDADQIKDIRAKGIDPMALLALEHAGATTTAEQHDILHILQCVAIETPEQINAEQEQSVRSREIQQGTSLFSNGYVASLYRDATIETNDVIEILEDENTI